MEQGKAVDLGRVKTGEDYGKQLVGIGGLIKEYRTEKNAEAGKKAFQEAWKNNDPEALAKVAIDHPDLAPQIQELDSMRSFMETDNQRSLWTGAQDALHASKGEDGTIDRDKLTDFLTTRIDAGATTKNKRGMQDSIELREMAFDPNTTDKELEDNLQKTIMMAERLSPELAAGAGKSTGKYSARSTTYKDGSMLMGDPQGGSRFYDPSGKEMPVGSAEREAGMVNAVASGIQYAHDEGEAGTRGKNKAAMDSETGDAARAKGVEIAKWEGKNEAEDKDVIQRMQTNLPSLRQAANKLKNLAATSSFSLPQRGFDTVMNQVFGISTKGGNARARMEAIADNMILPLLKETFGAAFTVEEGARLRASLVASNATPSAKVAQLEEFINMKTIDLQGKMAKYAGGDSGQQRFPEGMVITNGKGQDLIRKGGEWIPASGGAQ